MFWGAYAPRGATEHWWRLLRRKDSSVLVEAVELRRAFSICFGAHTRPGARRSTGGVCCAGRTHPSSLKQSNCVAPSLYVLGRMRAPGRDGAPVASVAQEGL